MDMKTKTKMEWALEYASKGWKIISVQSKSKRPLKKNGRRVHINVDNYFSWVGEQQK